MDSKWSKIITMANILKFLINLNEISSILSLD